MSLNSRRRSFDFYAGDGGLEDRFGLGYFSFIARSCLFLFYTKHTLKCAVLDIFRTNFGIGLFFKNAQPRHPTPTPT